MQSWWAGSGHLDQKSAELLDPEKRLCMGIGTGSERHKQNTALSFVPER